MNIRKGIDELKKFIKEVGDYPLYPSTLIEIFQAMQEDEKEPYEDPIIEVYRKWCCHKIRLTQGLPPMNFFEQEVWQAIKRYAKEKGVE